MNALLKLAVVVVLASASLTAWLATSEVVDDELAAWQRRAADQAQHVLRWEPFEYSCLGPLPQTPWAGVMVKGTKLQTLVAPADAGLSVVAVVRSSSEPNAEVDLEVTNYTGGPALCSGRVSIPRTRQGDEREELQRGIDALLKR